MNKLTLSRLYRYSVLFLMVTGMVSGCATHQAATDKTASADESQADVSVAESQAAPGEPVDPYEVAVEKATDPLSPERLVLVSRYGQPSTVRYLLQNGVDVNARDKFGSTALVAAAEGGHLEVLRMLLKAGADVNARTKDGETALIGAAVRGDAQAIDLLINAGADVDGANTIGETALFYAVRFGNEEAVAALLKHGADPNIRNRNRVNAGNSGFTALMYAAEGGHTAASAEWRGIAKKLLDHGADPNIKNNHGESALAVAVKNANLGVATALRTVGAREQSPYIGLDNTEALIKAVREGDGAKVQALLERGVDATGADNNGVTPLLAAAYEDRLEAAKLLLDNGARINRVPKGLGKWALKSSRVPLSDRELVEYASRGNPALLAAVRQGHRELVDFLLEAGADPTLTNRRGDAPIFVAAAQGQTDMVRSLLAGGVDPDTSESSELTVSSSNPFRSLRKNTPLIKAAQGGHTDTCKVLLEAGASPDHRGVLGKTALFWAVERGYARTAELLLEQGASPDVNNVAGLTPLMVAARNGNIRITNLLVEQGANVNQVERPDAPGNAGKVFGTTGMTPLIYAARGGHGKIVDILLQNGAEVNAMSQSGDTAMREAADNGYKKIVDRLKVAGAR